MCPFVPLPKHPTWEGTALKVARDATPANVSNITSALREHMHDVQNTKGSLAYCFRGTSVTMSRPLYYPYRTLAYHDSWLLIHSSYEGM